MQVVITGVAGFVGSNLAKRLLNKGYKVIGVDSMADDSPLEVKEQRLADLAKSDRFEFIKLSILNDGIFTILGSRKCDYFIHLASKDIYYQHENPYNKYGEFFEVNTLGTIRMYELANLMKASKFIATSTFSVYGNTKKQILSERKLLPDPISPHGASKIAMETALKYLHHHYMLPCIIPRVFSVYGPNMPVHTAVYHIVVSAIKKTPLKFHGDFFHQQRDFIYIDDVVTYLEMCFSKRLQFQIVNIASGKSVSFNQVIEVANSITGGSITDVTHAGRQDLSTIVPEYVTADIKKAEKLFKYRPITNLKEGLESTIDWYKENPKFLEFPYYK